MQKTAKKTVFSGTVPPTIGNTTSMMAQSTQDSSRFADQYQQWGTLGQACQPTITWQDTTSNATYSSASSVLNIT